VSTTGPAPDVDAVDGNVSSRRGAGRVFIGGAAEY
jgi:hypothetical protein